MRVKERPSFRRTRRSAVVFAVRLGAGSSAYSIFNLHGPNWFRARRKNAMSLAGRCRRKSRKLSSSQNLAKAGFSCLRCCKPQQHTYEAPWSISCDSMWSLTFARLRRAGGAENFSSPARKTFFRQHRPEPKAPTGRSAVCGGTRCAFHLVLRSLIVCPRDFPRRNRLFSCRKAQGVPSEILRRKSVLVEFNSLSRDGCRFPRKKSQNCIKLHIQPVTTSRSINPASRRTHTVRPDPRLHLPQPPQARGPPRRDFLSAATP